MIEEGPLHAVHASMGNFINLEPNYKVILGDMDQKFADEVRFLGEERGISFSSTGNSRGKGTD